MTTTGENTLAGYFTVEPLLGGDPFDFENAWDANLKPEEYGDQSSWTDDDEGSFTDSDEEGDEDDDSSCGSLDEEGDWSLVYSASFTVATSASTGALPQRNSLISTGDANSSPPPPPLPCQQPLERKDSKVRFCQEPPTIVSYESCSREDYSQLYYSVHELQTLVDELRMEKKSTASTAFSPSPAQNNSNLSNTTPTRST